VTGNSIISFYFIAFCLVTFLLWGMDKYRARVNQWRIPERTLLLLTFLGGSMGALAGMLVFRHKIRKPLFWVVVVAGCVFQGLIIFISLKLI
jgi:uncharacterized membrane protein YsdA (DUF1294 family)